MRAIGCCDYCVRTGDTEENQRSWCGGAKRRSRSPLSPSTLPVASHHERDRLRCFGFNGGVDNILHFLAKTVLLNVFLNGHFFFSVETGHYETRASPLVIRIGQPGAQMIALRREHV